MKTAVHKILQKNIFLLLPIFVACAFAFAINSPKVFAVPLVVCDNETAPKTQTSNNRVLAFCEGSNIGNPALQNQVHLYDLNIVCATGTIANEQTEHNGFFAWRFFCRPSGNISTTGPPSLSGDQNVEPPAQSQTNRNTSDGCTDINVNVFDSGPSKACGENKVLDYITAIIKFLTAGVGIVVVIMIVIGGIQYVTSAGDPNGVAAAKSRIVNAIIALLLFIFAAAILNFLIPGGLL